MKLNPSFSRFLSVLLWLTAAVLATVALNELLHRSKEPEVLFWSTKKLAFCLGAFIASMACFWTSKKHAVQGFPKPLEHSAAPFFVFLTISCLWFVLHMGTTPEVAGDIQYQMLGFRQYLEGVTTQINTQVVPIVDQDLAKDRIMPIVWYPPGPMWLLLPFTFLGLSPDWAARCLIFLGFLTGGMGFLVLAVRLGFTHKACLAFALVLALCSASRDGLGVITPTSADCIGLAIFPWLCIATLRLLDGLTEKTQVKKRAIPFTLLGLATGSLYLVKYSWFVAAAALAFFLGLSVFLFVRKLPVLSRVILMGAYSICFFVPFFWLNSHNQQLAGGDALDYNQKGSLGDNAFIEMVYGPNFSSTARPQELPFSLAAGPGFLLGGNLLATRCVHFLRQDSSFRRFFQEELNTNAHVWALILLCLPFSGLVIWLLYSQIPISGPFNGAFLLTMVVVPMLLLGYLSLKSGFNYIVKDNYRYVIPYSLMIQALLLHQWFSGWNQRKSLLWRGGGMLVIFWVCIFPGAWKLQAEARDTFVKQSVANPSVPREQILALASGNQKSITFFLNGHGPRKLGIVSREVQFSFILNGGLSEGKAYKASEPVRIVIAIEGSLEETRPEIHAFFQRFPGVDWEVHNVPGSLYTQLYTGDFLSVSNKIES